MSRGNRDLSILFVLVLDAFLRRHRPSVCAVRYYGYGWRSTVTSVSFCSFVCLSVCLSVCERISGTTCPIFTKFLYMLPRAVARLSSGRRCDTSCTCTFGFMHDDVILHIMDHIETCRYRCSEWRHCVVVRRIGIGWLCVVCVVSWMTAGAETWRVHRARSLGAEPAMRRCLAVRGRRQRKNSTPRTSKFEDESIS